MLSIPTSIAHGSLTDKLSAIAEAGFDGVELSLGDVASFDGEPRRIADLVDQAGLTITALGPVAGPLTAAGLEGNLRLAREMRAPFALAAIRTPDDLAEALRVRSYATPLALLPDRDMEQAVIDAVAGRDDPAVGIALDALKALGDGSRPARFGDFPAGRLFHLTFADGPGRPVFPGQGRLNLAGLARVFARLGYGGPWSVRADPQGADTVLNAYRGLATLLSDAALTEPALRASAPVLPPKVAARGIEFVEFAVGEADAAPLEAMLRAMAFRRERRHLSKRVTLWRQGAVNIVVNKEAQGHAYAARADHGACVCDMGLRVANARETVKRARALGSEDFHQEVGLGELAIPAIRGVGGTVVHFIDEASDLHRVWDIEFEPVSRTRATPPAGLRRIDHLAQTMRYDEMQSWLLYYLSTFEMQKSDVVQVADPSGITRSQAIETPEGEVRLNLNGATDQGTIADAFLSDNLGAGVQHIAFQTDDIFETSAALARRGFQRLTIPRNYYAQTQAEFGLDDDFVASLSAANLLYDRDAGGSYLQLYGHAILEGFFFEVVERRGRYAGYGARNAPVRLAAQDRARAERHVA